MAAGSPQGTGHLCTGHCVAASISPGHSYSEFPYALKCGSSNDGLLLPLLPTPLLPAAASWI